MRCMRVTWLPIILLLGCAESAPVEPEPQRGELAPPEQPQEAVLELSYRGGMIANPDPTPFVRVYPGGRVLVHYPAYMKRAGDYELQLDAAELEALLASFSSEDVLTLEEDELLTMAREIRQGQPDPQVDDHGVEAVVRIRGESFTPDGATSPVLRNIDHTLRAPTEVLDAAPESPFGDLRDLADGVRRLEQLARSESLRKIDE